ncbi:mercuric reductase [Hydrogenophaga sp.]|uniref:mercuric reductase n=1 Tax=Hydrogenophaga sp. TaxID=1904254 RepID=UPI00356B156C
MTTEAFDTIVIGAGQAGPSIAAKLATEGRKVALVESGELGGTCVNRGCTPTKTLRKSARVAYLARRAAEFGVEVGPVQVNFDVAMQRMQTRVDESRAGLASWLGGLDGLSIVKAHGRLSGRADNDFLIEAGSRTLRAPMVVLNTGTRAFVPPIPGLADIPYLDNESLLKLRELPRKLLIIGGGYISLEMGQIFRRLGSEVSIIEIGPRLTAREDEDVSAAIADMLRTEGIELLMGVDIARVLPGEAEGDARVEMTDGRTIEGSHLLVAVGRTPNTDDLGLKSVGLTVNERGYLLTNQRLETEVPGIWALGDINQRGAFTHTSYHDHDILAENLDGGQRSADARTSIYAMFTDPPLAHVGLYEADAKRLVAEGRRISQAVYAMKDVSRAKEESETTGLIKLLIDEDSGHFLGATMLGMAADEVIQSIGLVMASKGSWRQVREALPVHPTVTELLPTIIDGRKPL